MNSIEIYKGATASLSFTVVDGDGVAFDLTGATILFRASNGAQAISKSTTSGITVGSPATLGAGVVTIAPADTAAWPDGVAALEWAIDVVSGSNTYVVAVGVLYVRTAVAGVVPGVA